MSDKQEKTTPATGTEISDKLPLDHNSEMQLAAFVDGESRWWQSFFIRKKLCSCFESRQYVDRLERSSQCFKRQYSSESAKECAELAVADKVLNRITQEERLSLLRSLPSDYLRENSFFARLFSVDRLAWGSFGAAFASLIFLFVIPSLTSDSIANIQMANGQVVNAKQLVAFNPNSVSARNVGELQLAAENPEDNSRPIFFSQFSEGYAPIEQRPSVINRDGSFYLKRKQIAPQIVDVDWVRSAGRVKVLRDPNGKASILWVQKKQPSSNSFAQKSVSQPEVEFVSNK